MTYFVFSFWMPHYTNPRKTFMLYSFSILVFISINNSKFFGHFINWNNKIMVTIYFNDLFFFFKKSKFFLNIWINIMFRIYMNYIFLKIYFFIKKIIYYLKPTTNTNYWNFFFFYNTLVSKFQAYLCIHLLLFYYFF